LGGLAAGDGSILGKGWDVDSKATFPVVNWEKRGIAADEKEVYGNSENNQN
jgi:hypothetical protein